MQTKDGDTYNAEFPKRLRILMQGYSQRQFAAKLGVLHSYVSRYLHGSVPPASFCHLLVKKLGVNPVWLMTGEGEPFVAGITVESGRMAGNLLDLVKEMESVTRIKLGALAGKQHARVLRELNDALSRHEELRKKLNAHSESIFREIVEELGMLWTKGEDLDRAASLIKAGEQIARLCEAPALLTSFQRQCAHYQHLRGNVEESTRHMRDVVMRGMLRYDLPNEQVMRDARNLVQSLHGQLRIRDAESFVEGALAFSRRRGKHWPPSLDLLQAAATIDLERGRLRRAQQRLLRVHPLVDARTRRRATLPRLAILNFFTDTMTYSQVRALCDALPIPHYLSPLALWTEDERDLVDNAAFLTRKDSDARARIGIYYVYVQSLLEARMGTKRDVFERFDYNIERTAATGVLAAFQAYTAPVVRAQIAVMQHNLNLATRLIVEHDVKLQSAKPDVELPMFFSAIHCRNILRTRSLPKPLHARARAFFVKRIEAGYALFRPVLYPSERA